MSEYGIKELEAETGMSQAAIRSALRKSEFKKEGFRWGWPRKSEFQKVVKFVKEVGEKESTKKMTPKKETAPKKEAVAKKTASKKAAPKKAVAKKKTATKK